MPVISAPGHSSPEARHGVLYFVVSEVWAPLVDTAHLVNSIRTRSAPVSITMVFSFTAQMVPMMPPMVVISSPTVRESPHGLRLLLPLVLRADHKEVEQRKHQD